MGANIRAKCHKAVKGGGSHWLKDDDQPSSNVACACSKNPKFGKFNVDRYPTNGAIIAKMDKKDQLLLSAFKSSDVMFQTVWHVKNS